MSSSEGLLPVGYVDAQGIRHRTVLMSALSGREEELLGRAKGQALPALVTALLHCCVRQIGDIASLSSRVIAQLSPVDRQYLLLKLRQATFGDQVRTSLTCPWSGCGKRVGLSFALSDLLSATPVAQEEAAASAQALLDTTIETTCHECGRPFLAPFDIADFFFAEFNSSLDRLYREVHFLAYHYHWSEGAIMAMPLSKRRIFLDLLNDELTQGYREPSPWQSLIQEQPPSKGGRRATELWVEREDLSALAEAVMPPERAVTAVPSTINAAGITDIIALPDASTSGAIVMMPDEQAPPPPTDIVIPGATTQPTRRPTSPVPLAAVLDWIAAGEEEETEEVPLWPVQMPSDRTSRPTDFAPAAAFDRRREALLEPANVPSAVIDRTAAPPIASTSSTSAQPTLQPSDEQLAQRLPTAAPVTGEGQQAAPFTAGEQRLTPAPVEQSTASRRSTVTAQGVMPIAGQPRVRPLPSATGVDVERPAMTQPIAGEQGTKPEQATMPVTSTLQPAKQQRASRPNVLRIEETSNNETAPPPTVSAQPAVIQQTVIVREAPAAPAATPAFWERSYLRQSHLRILR